MNDDIVRLSIDIADEATAMDLGAYARRESIDEVAWLDIETPRHFTPDGDVLKRAVDYLSRRGMLIRHQTRDGLVRVGTHKPPTYPSATRDARVHFHRERADHAETMNKLHAARREIERLKLGLAKIERLDHAAGSQEQQP